MRGAWSGGIIRAIVRIAILASLFSGVLLSCGGLIDGSERDDPAGGGARGAEGGMGGAPTIPTGGTAGSAAAGAMPSPSTGGVAGVPTGGVAGVLTGGGGGVSPAVDAGSIADGAPDGADGAPLEPSCACPDGDYFIHLDTGDVAYHLAFPFIQELFCHETTVHFTNNGCDDAYRLTGCAGPASGPPCIYIAVRSSAGALIGQYIDANGDSYFLTEASLSFEEAGDRAMTGEFTAEFGYSAGVSVSGSFLACTTLFPPSPCPGD